MDVTGLNAASQKSSLPPQQLAQIKKAARDFEAMFMSEMMGHMFNGVKTDPMFGGGHGEDMFRSMMVQEYGKSMASSPQGTALSQQLERAMIQMQENLNNQRN